MNKIGLIAVSAILTLLIVQCDNPTNTDSESVPSNTTATRLAKTGETQFTGFEDHSITVEEAQQMMDDFQADNPFETYGWYFSRNAFEYILSNPAVVGIRIYGGLNADGSFSPVLIGADAAGKDLIKSPALKKSMEDPLDNGIREKVIPCPPICD